MKKILYIVVPCYNEEEMLPISSKAMLEKLNTLIKSEKISDDSRILFVNDGSKDKTWELICKLHDEDYHYSGLCLSHNRGHQNALLAGLETSAKYADMIASMDADLQDDINALDEMIDKYYAGNDVVYGVRKSRKKDTFFKRYTAQKFYNMMSEMGSEIVYNHADYRLMSKRAVNALSEYREVNLFLRGLVPMIGFKSDLVFYERGVREKGESKYPLKKMISFAYEGITSMTLVPIRFVRNLGVCFSILGFMAFVACLVLYFFNFPHMWMFSIIGFIWFMSGLILFGVGLIGDYVGKTYLESKHRPRYIISDFLNNETKKK